jgi:hypothetical protein
VKIKQPFILYLIAVNVVALAYLLYAHFSHSRGGLDFGVPFQDVAYCKKGRIIYRQIDADINWDKGLATMRYSWQCYISEQDNKRTKVILGTFDYEQMRKEISETKAEKRN